MGAPGPPGERIVLSARHVRRDLWVSLLVLVAGIVFYLASLLLRAGTGQGAVAVGLLVLYEAGWLLILVGLIFVAVNWWLLRRREGGPRAWSSTELSPSAVPGIVRAPGQSVEPPAPTRVACAGCARVWPVGEHVNCPACGAPLPR